MFQLTGLDLRVGQTRHSPGELADPGTPEVTADGRVRIFGTGHYYLEFAGWETFLRGGPSRPVPLKLRHPDGTPLKGAQAVWDLLPHDGVLYGGVMTPTGRRRHARWPQDNWTRRIYAFRERGGEWVREPEPLFGFPLGSGWVGHSYGHHFLTDTDGTPWIFYERVVEDRSGPKLTEIFARPMVSKVRAGDPEVPILGVGAPPFPATHRRDGAGRPNGYLVEGPRPVRVTVEGETFFLLGFSSGDFPTDTYGINVAISRRLLGPYIPLTTTTGTGEDLLDLGAAVRKTWGLSWGPARPCFFSDPWGKWWALFHAVRKDVLPDRNYGQWPSEPLHHFHRNLFLTPLDLALDENGWLRARLSTDTTTLPRPVPRPELEFPLT